MAEAIIPPMGQGVSQADVESFQGYDRLRARTSTQGKPVEYSNESIGSLITEGVPSVLASTVDTLGTSLGVLGEDDVKNFLEKNAPEVHSFFDRNREGVQLVGDIAFSLIPAGVAAKAIQGGGWLYRLLKAEKNPVLRRMFTSGGRFASQYRKMFREDLRLAGQGSLGEAFKIGRRTLTRDLKITRTLDGLKMGVAAELGILATMNESEILYPSDFTLTEHLAFGSLGVVLPASIEYAFARRLVAKSAKRAARHAYGALNPSKLPLTDVVSRPGGRDLAITVNAMAANTAETVAREVGPTNSAYAENLNRFRLGLLNRTKGYIRQLTNDNVPGVMPRGALSQESQVSLVTAVDSDPLSMLGVTAVRNIPGSRIESEQLIKLKANQVAKLKKSAQERFNKQVAKLEEGSPQYMDAMRLLDDELQKARELDEMAFTVITPRGNHIPLSDYRIQYVDDTSPLKTRISITQATQVNKKTYNLRSLKSPEGGRPNTLTVDSDLIPKISRVSENNPTYAHKYSSLSPYQRSGLYTLMQRAINDLPPDARLITGPNPSFMRVDAILTAVEKKPGLMRGLAIDPKFNHDIKALEFHGLNNKFKEYNRLYDQIEQQVHQRTMSAEAIRQQLNLPQNARGEISPIETLFSSLRQSGARDLSSFKSLDEFKQMVVNEINQFADDAAGRLSIADVRLRGSMLDQATHGQSFLPGVLSLRRPIAPHQMTQDAIEDAVYRQFDIRAALEQASKTGSTLVGRLGEVITNHAAYGQAKDVYDLSDAALLGGGTFNTSVFGSRAIPSIQAANVLETISEKESRTFVESLYKRANSFGGGTHEKALQDLTRTNNAADMELFSQYVSSRRHAWDLEAAPIKNSEGRFSFVLRDTEHNRAKFQQLFKEDMPQGALMPAMRQNGRYTPLQMTARAMSGAEVLRDLGSVLRKEQNALASLTGRSGLKEKQWWIPPINLKNKEVAFLMNPADFGGANKKAIVARTPSELRRQISSPQVQRYIKENNAIVVTPDDFNRYANLYDDVFHQMLDATDFAVQIGKVGAGSSAQIVLENGRQILGESLQAIRNQVNSVSKRTMHVLFEPQISFSRMMKRQLGTPKGQITSVYDVYANSVIGNRGLNRQSYLGKFYSSVESLYDDVLLAIYDKTAERGLTGVIKDNLQQGFGVTQAQHKKLVDQIGSFAPVEHTIEELGRRLNIRPPSTMQKQLAAVNSVTTALVLRMFELGHPLLNFSGVVATMPAVIQALKQYPHENTREWAARIGAFGTPIKMGDDLIGKLSPVKMIANAAHHPFTPQGKVDWDDMVRLGFMRQEVAEISRTITQPERGFTTSLGSRATDFVSFMSDRSEELSRGWAHMAGVKLARENLGITETRNIHSFAHKFANELIGDYRAVNRPQIFQGAVGLPLGLFQTYVWNYYQRLFGYIENHDFRSLATQIAMQASVFGAATIPGYALYSDMFATNFDGTNNPIDALNNKLGPQAADWILNGTLSNIPKIFSNDGIALYSRGDVNFQRLPAFINPTQAPIVQLAQRTFNMVGETLDQFRSGGQVSTQRMMEIMATYSMNRPFARLMEVAAGYAVDRRGQVISDEVRSGISIAARVLAQRPTSEQKQIETSYRMRQTEFAQRELRSRTRKGLRSAIRGDALDMDDVRKALFDYIHQGGNPAYFTHFLRDQFIAAVNPKARLELERALKGGKLADILRLYNAQVPLED